MKRKICVVNGKRGGFNALLPTMRAIALSDDLELQVVLTDMHLSVLFGRTLEYAKKWIKIDATVDLAQTGDTARERVEALGRGLTGFAKVFSELQPDIVLLLGDRSETLTAAFAALQLKISIAHIQGGEISGNIDGIQRHAITKLAHIHFTETEAAKGRVLALGEEPWRVHFTGAPYLDFIVQKLYTPEDEVRAKFGLKSNEPFLLVLQHPVTTEPENSYMDMTQVLNAVKKSNMRAIIAYPCSDQGYQGIINAIEEEQGNPLFSIHKNIPAEDFIGLEAIASALVGNSSAGIYEAPYVGCPVVNVGKRQEGRECELNVLNSPTDYKSILFRINKILDLGLRIVFGSILGRPGAIYGDGRAHERIVHVLRTVKLDTALFEKKMMF